MTFEKLCLKAVTLYHANLIDIHNGLHALGIRDDEQAENFNKKHTMAIINAYARRGYNLSNKED